MSGSDRELLELAAKAAGYQIEWVRNSGCHYRCEQGASREQWCPLDDDGDALRLAVKMSVYLQIHDDQVIACLEGQHFAETLYENGCMDIATRRVIVRAAAEIGRSMP